MIHPIKLNTTATVDADRNVAVSLTMFIVLTLLFSVPKAGEISGVVSWDL